MFDPLYSLRLLLKLFMKRRKDDPKQYIMLKVSEHVVMSFRQKLR